MYTHTTLLRINHVTLQVQKVKEINTCILPPKYLRGIVHYQQAGDFNKNGKYDNSNDKTCAICQKC